MPKTTPYTILTQTLVVLTSCFEVLGSGALEVIVGHPTYKQHIADLNTAILAGDLEETKQCGRQFIRWVRAGDYRTEDAK